MIKSRLGIDANLEPTSKTGQFDVRLDDKLIASRGGMPLTRILFGAGFPNPEHVLDVLAKHRG